MKKLNMIGGWFIAAVAFGSYWLCKWIAWSVDHHGFWDKYGDDVFQIIKYIAGVYFLGLAIIPTVIYFKNKKKGDK